jgi:hypothetical protein
VQRIRQSAAATLQVVLTDQYGDPADAPGVVTVSVDRASGSELVASTTATAAGAGVYTVALTAGQTATLDELTATWHDVDNNVDWTTHHRIVGGFLFTIQAARDYDESLSDTAKTTSAQIAARRDEVEDEAEWICDRAFVPSYARVTASGDGTARLTVGKHDIRRVRAVRIYGTLNGSYADLTADELASIAVIGGGDIRRTDGGVFPFGVANIIADVEYGLDAPDEQMSNAAIRRLRSRINAPKNSIPERTRAWTDPNGNNYEFDGPDAYRTGIASVDAVYLRYSLRKRANESGAPTGDVVPASRTLSFDPQWWGLFRGGPR